MTTDVVSTQDLYPSAREMFAGTGRVRQGRSALVWLIAGALAAVVAQRVLAWVDRRI